MSEIGTIKRVAKIMPGIDYHTGDKKAYDLQNTIIVGRTGSGVNSIVNNIIFNLVQDYTAKEVSIQYFPIVEKNNPWLNKNRIIPHFSSQCYDYTESEHGLRLALLDNLRSLVYEKNSMLSEDMLCTRHHVYIIEVNKKLMSDKYIRTLVSCLVKFSGLNRYHSVILVADEGTPYIEKLEPYFDLRILTRTEEATSNKFLGCNLAAQETREAGFAWIVEQMDWYTKKCYQVPYKPDTFYSKTCKHLSTIKFPLRDSFELALLKCREESPEDKIPLVLFMGYIGGLKETTPDEFIKTHSNMTKAELYEKVIDVLEEFYLPKIEEEFQIIVSERYV